MPTRQDVLRAHAGWAAAPVWTVHAESGRAVGGVRPGVQWFVLGEWGEVLVRGGDAWLRGTLQLTMAGAAAGEARRREVVGDRWLRCDAAAYLRHAHDASAIGMLGKPVLGAAEGEPGADVTLSADGARVLGFAADGERYEVRYDDVPLPLPSIDPAGVVPLAEAAAALAPSRRRARRRAVTVEVSEAEGCWTVRSPDLAAALGVGGGVAAEAVLLAHLAAADPGLRGRVEADSYDTVVCLHVPDVATAEAVRAAVAGVAGRA